MEVNAINWKRLHPFPILLIDKKKTFPSFGKKGNCSNLSFSTLGIFRCMWFQYSLVCEKKISFFSIAFFGIFFAFFFVFAWPRFFAPFFFAFFFKTSKMFYFFFKKYKKSIASQKFVGMGFFFFWVAQQKSPEGFETVCMYSCQATIHARVAKKGRTTKSYKIFGFVNFRKLRFVRKTGWKELVFQKNGVPTFTLILIFVVNKKLMKIYSIIKIYTS